MLTKSSLLHLKFTKHFLELKNWFRNFSYFGINSLWNVVYITSEDLMSNFPNGYWCSDTVLSISAYSTK